MSLASQPVEGRRKIPSTPAFHWAILVAGTLFLLVGAFHGNVWFDESYSIAIASHGFSEIWRIGAGDVHPVLFYWALHCLFLLFGQNVLVYRLFAVAGAVALGALGLSHIRRDFGWRCGTIFTFLALFTPYMAVIAVEIRMYSWAAFAIMLCFLSAWRIFQRTRANVAVGWGSWTAFFLSSLAAAYLHYFGAIAAFMVNACLLTALIRLMRQRGRSSDATGAPRALALLAGGALVQLALYAPWLSATASQMSVVSQTYWANIVFPTTFIELAIYPLYTSQVAFALRGSYGLGWQMAFQAVGAAVLIILAATLICALTSRKRHAREAQGTERRDDSILSAAEAAEPSPTTPRSDGRADVQAAIAALIVYLGTVAIAFVSSFVMGSFIVYYRYLFVAIGPLLFAASVGLAHLSKPVFRSALLALVFALSLMTQCLLCSDNYDPQNRASLEYFDQTAQELDADRGATPLVVSSDIGVMGVTSVEFPDIAQTYLDWQKGNWALSYEAYAPTMTSVKSWELMLDDYEGDFIVLGQSSAPTAARDVVDLSQKRNVELLSQRVFYRPYERTYFTVALMRKTDGAPLS